MKKILIILLLLLTTQSVKAESEALEDAGDIGQIALPAAAIIATILHEDKEGGWEFAKAYGATLATVYLLKVSINRPRPSGGDWSFPSGHTASAAVGAAYLQRRYGWEYGIPAYLVTGLVAYSRVEAEAHYASDVIAGAAIGIIYNFIFTDRYHAVQVAPFSVERYGNGVGLSLTIDFD